MPDWCEEMRPAPKFGRKCELVWLGKCHDTARHGGALDYEGLSARQVVSRLDGMRELSDKAATERCLARCRAAGLPGFGPGGASGFPRTWTLPEERGPLEKYLKSKRRKGKTTPTVIVKPAGGSEGNGIFLVQVQGRCLWRASRVVGDCDCE